MGVVVLVLAAGNGRRFGGPKALARVGDTTFVERVLATCRAVDLAEIVVVTGASHDAVAALVGPSPGTRLARNPDPDRGQLSSLLVGIDAAAGADAVLAWPVDLPFVQPTTVRRVLEESAKHPGNVVIPRHGDRGGHPTLLPAALFSDLRALSGNDGARELFTRRPDRVFTFDVDDPAVHRDVDTPADLAALGAIAR